VVSRVSKLYDVLIEAETDQVREQIGFRSIETRGTDILLNGKPIFLRGICIHEEAPLRGGRAYSREDASHFSTGPKSSVRILSVWPTIRTTSSWFAKLIGWESSSGRRFLFTGPSVGESGHTRERANQLREMINRDKNRAAVVIWSVANETPLSDARLAFLKDLIAHARQLDPTRLLSAAMERHYLNPTTQMIDDPLG
jgi:beta-glucuronidase